MDDEEDWDYSLECDDKFASGYTVYFDEVVPVPKKPTRSNWDEKKDTVRERRKAVSDLPDKLRALIERNGGE